MLLQSPCRLSVCLCVGLRICLSVCPFVRPLIRERSDLESTQVSKRPVEPAFSACGLLGERDINMGGFSMLGFGLFMTEWAQALRLERKWPSLPLEDLSS